MPEQYDGYGARALRDWILAESMSTVTEMQLQNAIWDRLAIEDAPSPIIVAAREYRLSKTDRVDFLIDMRGPLAWQSVSVAVEVKIGGSLVDVTRQLTRYADSTEVHELLLVTTKASHHRIPPLINGKPVVLCTLVEAGL
ncbi:hypothetical protein [Microbacterium sp.]|uniref:hypothetical protein n=1 Tax=Microbacterium sp. TaxID=51671 RepID=UPI003F715315